MKDCDVTRRATIAVTLEPRSPHVLTLTANVTESANASEFDASSYEWTFGDGTQKTTREPQVQHSYEGVPHDTRFSYFLITVKVTDRRGQQVRASRSYGFANFGFGPLVDEHRVVVFSAGGSLPGELSSEGEHVRLYHGYEGTVVLDRVTTKEQDFSAGGHEMSGPEYSAEAILGVRNLPPGKATSSIDLSRFRPTRPGRVRVLELLGHADGMDARGRIMLSSVANSDPTLPPPDSAPIPEGPTLLADEKKPTTGNDLIDRALTNAH
jgi:hypothetical protein